MRDRAFWAHRALSTSGGTALSSARAITWSKIDFFVCGHEVLCGENCIYRVEKHLYFCIYTKMPSSNPLPPKENALFKRILVSKRSANFLFWSPTLGSPRRTIAPRITLMMKHSSMKNWKTSMAIASDSA